MNVRPAFAPAGGRRAEQKRATRVALIEAARVRFTRDGYSATRLEDVAADAGASPATLYLHFPTKRDLVLEFAGELHSIGVEYYQRLLDVAADPTDAAISEWTRSTLETWPNTAPMTRFVEEAAATDSVVMSALSDLLAVGVGALEAGFATRPAPLATEAMREHATVAMAMHHGLFREYQHGNLQNSETLLPLLTKLWATILRDE